MKKAVHSIVLLSSMSTLICCALPALFVALGAGAAVASLTSSFPALVWVSAHKIGVFIFAGCMLTIGGIMRYRQRNAPCPIDPAAARACGKMRKISFYVYIFSLVCFATGLFFAYIAPKLFF